MRTAPAGRMVLAATLCAALAQVVWWSESRSEGPVRMGEPVARSAPLVPGLAAHPVAFDRFANRATSMGEDGHWFALNVSGPRPKARSGHTAIVDGRGRLVIFGGVGENWVYLNDTWIFDPALFQWQQVVPPGGWPPGRYGALGSYDPVRDRLLIYGGLSRNTNHDDAWALNLSDTPPTWVQFVSGPPVLDDAEVFQYDPVGDQLIMIESSFNNQSYRHSLPIDGFQQWVLLTPPEPAILASMGIYDPFERRILVLGTSEFAELTLDPPLAWQTHPASGAQGIGTTNPVFDLARRRVVTYGGHFSIGVTAFDPATGLWTDLQPTGNPPYPRGAGAYIPSLDGMLYFGGSTIQISPNDPPPIYTDKMLLLAWSSPLGIGPTSGSLMLSLQSPNPLRGDAIDVAFTLPAPGAASLELMDVRGRRVGRRDVGSLGPGRHHVSLAQVADLPAGVYFVRLSHAGRSVTQKLALLH